MDPLVTLTELKAKMQLTSTADDSWLTSELGMMSAIVVKYCERLFRAQSDYVETFYDWPETNLWLGLMPVLSLTSVVVDGTALDLSANPSPLIVDKAAGALRFRDPASTFCGADEIVCTYSGGYADIDADTTGVPDDVKRVVMDLVQSRYLNKGEINDPTRRLRSESIPDVANFIYERSKAFDDEPLLGPYAHILDQWRSVRATHL